jgi:uncharacterized membrane protein
MKMRRTALTLGVVTALMLAPLHAMAQTSEGVSLFTPFPGVIVGPGATASFDITATGPAGARAPLAVEGLPDGWTASFRGESATVDLVAITSEGTGGQLRLDVVVPESASPGTVELTVTAGGATLPLSVTVEEGAAGSLTLAPDFPGQRGPVDGDFTFRVTVSNDTAADLNLSLEATGPEGWDVSAEPTTQAQASVITVAAGGSETVNLTASPPPAAEAGLYEVGMTASAEGAEAELTVAIELVGDFSVSLTTPDQRLNAEVTIGETTQLPILVVNDGTAVLESVVLSAQPPSGWEVTIDPEAIPALQPGESFQATASITPAGDALAGDYDLGFNASAGTATDSMSIRTTVNPSALWGIVGVALIALTLAGLALVFRRFGRR